MKSRAVTKNTREPVGTVGEFLNRILSIYYARMKQKLISSNISLDKGSGHFYLLTS